jgi:N-acetyl-gamma-glutamylphosphate reductase
MNTRRTSNVQSLQSGTPTQVKFTIEADIVSAFKARCAAEGVSMTSAVRQYMKTSKPTKDVRTMAHTRPLRRKAVMEIIGLLNDILDTETAYRDNIPEVFEQRYEVSDYACDRLADAIGCLEEAF